MTKKEGREHLDQFRAENQRLLREIRDAAFDRPSCREAHFVCVGENLTSTPPTERGSGAACCCFYRWTWCTTGDVKLAMLEESGNGAAACCCFYRCTTGAVEWVMLEPLFPGVKDTAQDKVK